MKWAKAAIFALLIAAAWLLDRRFGWSEALSGEDVLGKLRALAEREFWQAALIYTAVTVVGCVVLAVPGVTFAVFAGVLFGPWLGILLCLTATTLGACASFLAGRFFLRDFFKPLAEKNRHLKRLLFDSKPKNEVLVLMITRLVPLFPYNLQNFAYGITDIGFWKYTVCTFVFMLPGVAMFTVGAAGFTVSEGRAWYFLAALVLLAAVLAAGWLLRRRYVSEGDDKDG